MIDHDLIERTLQEIGMEYKPGLISWIKEDRDRWAMMLDLEDRINKATLAGDEGILTKALEEYREFFREMISQFSPGMTQCM